MSITRSLPNHQTTTDPDVYVKAWRDLAKPIEELFDIRLYGFDPSLTFISRDGSETLQLSVAFVTRLTKNLEARKPDAMEMRDAYIHGYEDAVGSTAENHRAAGLLAIARYPHESDAEYFKMLAAEDPTQLCRLCNSGIAKQTTISGADFHIVDSHVSYCKDNQ